MALAPRLAPGSIFARDFKVVDLLAEGGMGAVYRVEQLSTHKPRALKLVSARLASDPKGHQRFIREATVGASIDSEHVVEVIGAGIDDETRRPWLAMELLDGADLGAVVGHYGRLRPGQLREVAGQLCHGLAAAHRAGVVHRDLKPANVFVARSRRAGVPFTIKILDFGIAKVVQESGTGATETDTVGSPLWMAPEQLNAERPTPATDVWALGLLAFWALTGKHYWWSAHAESSTVQALFVEQLFKAIEAPSQRAEGLGVSEPLPAGFDEWFLRCLERDASRRFVDAAAAGEQLLQLLPAEPGAAAQLLPKVELRPSTGITEPHHHRSAASEETLQGDPATWDARAVLPASAIAAARSSFEGEATRAEASALGADLSRGPIPGMPGDTARARPRVSPVLVTVAVALVVAVFLGGGYLLWELLGGVEVEVSAGRTPPADGVSPDDGTTGESMGSSGTAAELDQTPPDLGASSEDHPILDLVVPLRTQLGEHAHEVDFLGWSPQGHRFALRVQYRDDRKGVPDRLTLIQIHDALTGTMIESFLVERQTGPGVSKYKRLAKAEREALARGEWVPRRESLRIGKRGPTRERPGGGSLSIEAGEVSGETTMSFPPSSLGVAFRWSGLRDLGEQTPRGGPPLSVYFEQEGERWLLLELPAPFGHHEVLEGTAPGAEAPQVTGRVLAYWSPDGRRVVLLVDAEATPEGAAPLRLRRWALRAVGPQIRMLEAGAGQRRAREVARELGDAGLPVAELALREPAVGHSTLTINRSSEGAKAVAERIRGLLPLLPAPEAKRLRGWADVVIALGHDAQR